MSAYPSTSPLRSHSLLTNRYRDRLERMLLTADIRLNGTRPWDIQVHNDAFYARIFSKSSVGLGESYMDGWWDCEQLDQMIYLGLRANLHKRLLSWRDLLAFINAKVLNLQTKARSLRVAEQHYDLDNDLYLMMLDKRMIYSCAYWKHAADLDGAQETKLDLVFRKLDLRPGMRVLDIGCGWGGAAKYAVEHYGAEVIGVTVSKEQAEFARINCQGLPIEIREQDYRQMNETFDRIYSLGMFEHVGYKNYRSYMQVARRCLKHDGMFLLHTIGANYSDPHGNPWVERYIFPNSMLPSIAQIGKAIENIFVMEDWQNFGPDYDRTLLSWHENFKQHWYAVKSRYDDRFYRMWSYYLLTFAGSFRARYNQLWQIVLSPGGLAHRYDAPR